MSSMDMEVYGRAYSSAVSGNKPWIRRVAPMQAGELALIGFGTNADSIVPSPENPVAVIEGNPFWDKLPKSSREWMSAILSARFERERFAKMAENCLVSMTGATSAQARQLAYEVRDYVNFYFSKEDHAAVSLRWAEALRPNRKLPTWRGSMGARWK